MRDASLSASAASGSAIVDRGECESSLQRIRRQSLLLRFELTHGDVGEILVLGIRCTGKTSAQPLDARLQALHSFRECFGSRRIFFAGTLNEHPSAARLLVRDLELAQLFARAPEPRLIARI